MSDYKYSQEAIAAWRKLLRAKLEMWEAANQLEEVLGRDCDTGADALDYIATMFDSPECAEQSGAADLASFLGDRKERLQ